MSIASLDNVEIVAFNSLQSDPNKTIGATVRNISSYKTNFCGFTLHNNDTSLTTWVQFFFKPSGDVMLGTTAPDFTIKLPANSSIGWDFEHPIRQGTGLSVASTTTETGSSAPATLTTGCVLHKPYAR